MYARSFPNAIPVDWTLLSNSNHAATLARESAAKPRHIAVISSDDPIIDEIITYNEICMLVLTHEDTISPSKAAIMIMAAMANSGHILAMMARSLSDCCLIESISDRRAVALRCPSEDDRTI
jgi:hypothetical protein